MNKIEALSSLRFAMDAFVAATSVICDLEDTQDDEEYLKISVQSEIGEVEILISHHGAAINTESNTVNNAFPTYDLVISPLRGKPKKLPPRTCPRCHGKGVI